MAQRTSARTRTKSSNGATPPETSGLWTDGDGVEWDFSDVTFDENWTPEDEAEVRRLEGALLSGELTEADLDLTPEAKAYLKEARERDEREWDAYVKDLADVIGKLLDGHKFDDWRARGRHTAIGGIRKRGRRGLTRALPRRGGAR